MEHKFRELSSILKNNALFPDVNHHLSSGGFLNEFQLIHAVLSLYLPGYTHEDEEGIDISIELFQIRKIKNETISYTSNIRFDVDNDLIFDDVLYVVSNICTTSGAYILSNDDYEINTENVHVFDKELSNAIEDIFEKFKENTDLIISKLWEIKKIR